MAAMFLPLFETLFRGHEKHVQFVGRRTFFEAFRGSPRPAQRKTYWHEDKARLTGTRIYIIVGVPWKWQWDCGAL